MLHRVARYLAVSLKESKKVFTSASVTLSGGPAAIN